MLLLGQLCEVSEQQKLTAGCKVNTMSIKYQGLSQRLDGHKVSFHQK